MINAEPREAFQANTLVTQLHDQVNSAVMAFWKHVVAEPAEQPPDITRTDTSSTVAPASQK